MYVKVRILTANGGHWLNIQKMRTCFKRVVFAMLFMAMALSLSAHDIEQDGIYYDVVSISELTVKAVGLAGNKEGDVVIPEQIVLNGRNLSVLSVADEFAKNNKKITNLTILTQGKIGVSAFQGCSNLYSVTISDTLVSAYAFSGCSLLETVDAKNLTSIEVCAFSNCTSLITCDFPSVKEIKESAFYNCSMLEHLLLPMAEKIGDNAFENCLQLSAFELTNSVKETGYDVFKNCKNLQSIVIGNGITLLNDIFSGCNNLQYVKIVDSKKELCIGRVGNRTCVYDGEGYTNSSPHYWYEPSRSMFSKSNNIKEVYIGRNLITECFRYKESYQSGAYYYDYQHVIPNPAFSNSKVEKVIFGPEVTRVPTTYPIPEINSSKNIYVRDTWDGAFQNCTNLVEVINLAQLNIPENAFKGCVKLTSITSDARSIGQSAFEGCSALEALTLGRKIEKIGSNAIKDCTSLKTINIASMTPPSCEADFPALNYIQTQVNIPYETASLYQNADYWKNFWGLTENIISDFTLDNIVYRKVSDNVVAVCGNKLTTGSAVKLPEKVSFQGFDFDVTSINYHAFYNCANLKSIVVPNSVKDIEEEAFYGSGLRTVTLPNSIKTIKKETFRDCKSLYSVTFPSGINSIGEAAFYGCGFISMKIPNTVEVIQKSTFEKCSKLENVEIPLSVTKIEDSAFCGCNLGDEILIPNSVTSLGNACFSSTALRTVTIPNSVTEMGTYVFGSSHLETVNWSKGLSVIPASTFYDTYIKSISIPDWVTEIGERAFGWCYYLREVNIPQSVTTIGESAFENCEFLPSINLPSSVIKFGKNIFHYCHHLKKVTFEDGDDMLSFSSGDLDTSSTVYNTTIKYYYGGFYDTKIEDLYIGSSLSDKPRYSLSGKLLESYDGPFSKMERLKKLTIGKNVSTLGPRQEYIAQVKANITPGSFKFCTAIDTVIVEATNPPIGAEFTDSVYQHSTLIVPEGCIDAYRQTDGWKEFCNIFTPSTTDIKGYMYDLEKIKIEHNSSGINILNATNSDVYIYNIMGVLIYKSRNYKDEVIPLKRGQYLVKINEKTIKIIY